MSLTADERAELAERIWESVMAEKQASSECGGLTPFFLECGGLDAAFQYALDWCWSSESERNDNEPGRFAAANVSGAITRVAMLMGKRRQAAALQKKGTPQARDHRLYCPS